MEKNEEHTISKVSDEPQDDGNLQNTALQGIPENNPVDLVNFFETLVQPLVPEPMSSQGETLMEAPTSASTSRSSTDQAVLNHLLIYKVTEMLQPSTSNTAGKAEKSKKSAPSSSSIKRKPRHSCQQKKILQDFFKTEKHPNVLQKHELARAAGLTYTQIIDWFKDERYRHRKTGDNSATTAGKSEVERNDEL